MGFSARTAGRAAACLVIAFAGAGLVEWDHYRRLVGWHKLHLSAWDRTGLLWLVAAKSLAVLWAPLAAATALDRLGKRQAARWLFLFGVAAAAVWLCIDAPVRAATGNHLHELLTYAQDQNAGEYAGDVRHALTAFLPTLCGWTAFALFAVAACGCWAERGRKPQHRQRLLGGAAAWAAALVGVFPAARSVAARDVAARLGAALPFSIGAPPPATTGSAQFLALAAELEGAVQRECAAAGPADKFGPPADFDAKLPAGAKRPNLVVLVLESFRRDAFNPIDMPRLWKWARQSGWRWEKHYSGSNSSETGMFALLYGRNSALYDRTLDAAVPPQLPLTFRQSGYRTCYVTSGTTHWQRMNEFVNHRTFDQALLLQEGPIPERDAAVVERLFVETRQARGDGRPRLLVGFFNSTHFFYECPPQYARRQPVVERYRLEELGDAKLAPLFKNRYRNALGYMDDLLADFVDRLDPAENVVVLTGDHGEGLFDDGCIGHGNCPSEVQHAVPLAIVGAGLEKLPPLGTATRHADLLPTLLHLLAGQPTPVARCHGRDLLVAENRTDELVLAPLRRWEPRHWMLVRGDERLLVKVDLRRARVEPAHFLTPLGQPTFDGPQDAGAAAAWSALFRAEFRRCTAP